VTDLEALLRADGVSVAFGGVQALVDVHLAVGATELVGLIGPNGAGKTTFIDAVTGFAPATGSVTLDGRELLGRPPHRRVASGIGRTFQSLELFEDLTVRENLMVAAEPGRWWAPITDLIGLKRRVELSPMVAETLDLVGLVGHVDAYPTDISLAQRKLVCVARALANNPRLLLLDEPAAGLDSDASLELGRELRRIAARGVTILLVDHDMDLVMDVCERINVLDFGVLIAAGDTSAVRQDEKVLSAYLGMESTEEVTG